MHTDEFEISIGREISLCRKMIKRLRHALDEREKQYGMTTEAFLLAPEPGRPAEWNRDLKSWCNNHEELQRWQQMLSEYEKALQTLKGI